MATIKKLRLKLKSGLLSELQSDTIFGHFAWRFKETHGEKKLIQFLELFKNGEPVFTISDGLFEKNNELFFPKPLKLTHAKFNASNKKERIKSFIKQKESKSVKLITLEQLNLYLNGNLDGFEKSLLKSADVKFPKFEQDLRVHVEIDRGTFTSKDGQLFTVSPRYLESETSIVLFVKILNQRLWDSLDCGKILRSVFEIGFGKKKSSGYGQFDVIGNLEDFNGFNEPGESNGFITLSRYLPSNSDKITDAYYDINVKYGKFGEEKSNSPNPFKKPLLLMKPGSCFMTDVKKGFYGRVVKDISDYFPSAIHNGIAFTLNAKF